MAKTDSSKVVLDLSPGAARLAPKGNNYLLLIAIDEYEHCPRLFNCVRDANDLLSELTARYHFNRAHAKTLFNSQATKDNLEDAFRWAAQTVTPTDNLFVYFSGHGEFDPVFNRGFWVPVEAQKGRTSQYVPNSDVRDFVAAIRSHHTFLVVDSCFSGSLFIGKGTEKSLRRSELDPSRWGLTSGRLQIVSDGKPGDNSPFAEALLYRLRSCQSSLDVPSLCAYVVEQVQAKTSDQSPIGEPLRVDGHKSGQFVLHLRLHEEEDWATAQAAASLPPEAGRGVAALEDFLKKYPESKHRTDAFSLIRRLRAEALWQQIQAAPDGTTAEIFQKNRLIDQYLQEFPGEPTFDAAAGLGEKLEWKEKFLRASESGKFALVRFLSGNPSFFKSEAEAVLAELRRKEIEADRQAEERRQQSEAERLQVEALAAEERRKKAEAKKAADAEADRLRREALAAEERRKKEEAKKAADVEADRLRREALAAEEQRKKDETKKASDAAERQKKEEAQRQADAETARRAAEARQQEKAKPNRPETNYTRYGLVAFAVLALLVLLIWRPWQGEAPSGQSGEANLPTSSVSDPFASSMVKVVGGTFTMGCKDGRDSDCSDDEKPPHEVTVNTFEISKYEVTQAQWKAVMGDNPSYFKCENCPVEQVSWDTVQLFLKKLNEQTSGGYRLPSEAEWEFAARGGNKSKGFKFAGSDNLDEVGWFTDNSGDKTRPVGGKKANELGIFDMSGNVWEWCQDTWHDNYQGAPDNGSAWVDSQGANRVSRGGGGFYQPLSCRLANRSWDSPTTRYRNLGFRLARALQ